MMMNIEKKIRQARAYRVNYPFEDYAKVEILGEKCMVINLSTSGIKFMCNKKAFEGMRFTAKLYLLYDNKPKDVGGIVKRIEIDRLNRQILACQFYKNMQLSLENITQEQHCLRKKGYCNFM